VGSGACVRLNYSSPGGAATGSLLPAGDVISELHTNTGETFQVSLVDSSNPVAFVQASDLGKTATELPQHLDADEDFMLRMEGIRCAASVAMGLSNTAKATRRAAPKVAIVAEPADFTSLDDSNYKAQNFNIAVRIISMGNVHRAITLTGAMCVATAVRIPGTIAHRVARTTETTASQTIAAQTPAPETTIIGNPSGLLPVEASVSCVDSIHVESTTTYRTQRRLMEGTLPLPSGIL